MVLLDAAARLTGEVKIEEVKPYLTEEGYILKSTPVAEELFILIKYYSNIKITILYYPEL